MEAVSEPTMLSDEMGIGLSFFLEDARPRGLHRGTAPSGRSEGGSLSGLSTQMPAALNKLMDRRQRRRGVIAAGVAGEFSPRCGYCRSGVIAAVWLVQVSPRCG